VHQIAHVVVNVSRCLRPKLISREIIFEVFQPVTKTYVNVTDRQTDRQTNDLLWHNRACEASRDKNRTIIMYAT